MAAITQVWDSSYENIPADNDQASEGALRIRNLKRDIRERAEVDHDWDDTTDAGKHLQVVFRDPLGADPGDVADEGILYTKDVAAKVELFWKDEDGNVLQLTDVGKSLAFASGTKMLFQQTAAPTGWTKDTTHDDKALRVVTGTASSGGTNSFSSRINTAFNSVAEAAHTHTGTTATGTPNFSPSDLVAGSFTIPQNTHTHTFTSAAGSSHLHSIDMNIQYVDLIIATKD